MASEQLTTSESTDLPLIPGDNDMFNGVIVKERHYGSVTVEEFHQRLQASLAAWRSEGRRGVWLRIRLDQSDLIPAATKLGFQFHHAKPDYVMMNQWLPTQEENALPSYASHNIGVAGFVVNERNEVLLVQEKWLRNIKVVHWKLPGGVAETGEDLWQTAIRETLEETGIPTEFISVLCFRHMHGYKWGTDDLYFSCLLRPLHTDIKINPNEIAAAKWMDVDAYIADPETVATNRMIAQAYKDGQARGLFLQPTIYPHFIKGRQDQVMYFNKSCDIETKSCDPGAKSHDGSVETKSNM